jgi:hypothetical protein
MMEKKEVPPVVEGQDLTVKQILERLPEQMVWRTTEYLQTFTALTGTVLRWVRWCTTSSSTSQTMKPV